MDFLFGILAGFFVGFFTIKAQIKKSGAGEMKVCKTCPYYEITDGQED